MCEGGCLRLVWAHMYIAALPSRTELRVFGGTPGEFRWQCGRRGTRGDGHPANAEAQPLVSLREQLPHFSSSAPAASRTL